MIPAEAVEAAAKGIWQYYETSAASNSAEPTNEDMAIARAALEAAAPYMRADALDGAAKKLRSDMDVPQRIWVANKVRALAMIERGDG